MAGRERSFAKKECVVCGKVTRKEWKNTCYRCYRKILTNGSDNNMYKIPVHWNIKIKERLEQESTFGISFKNIPIVKEFIKPIIDYGNKEEWRITKHFLEEENKRRRIGENDKGEVSKEINNNDKVTV